MGLSIRFRSSELGVDNMPKLEMLSAWDSEVCVGALTEVVDGEGKYSPAAVFAVFVIADMPKLEIVSAWDSEVCIGA